MSDHEESDENDEEIYIQGTPHSDEEQVVEDKQVEESDQEESDEYDE